MAVPLGALVVPGLDEVANQLLGFETAIDAEVELAGPIKASLAFSCNEIDSHVFARLSRVARDGTRHTLSLGSIRPALRRIDAARSTRAEIAFDMDRPEPLTPGEPVVLRFSLTPQPVVLQPGERLRLDIGSRLDLLRRDQSHGRAQFDMQVPPYYARNTLHYGPDTWIEVDRALTKASAGYRRVNVRVNPFCYQ